MDDEGVDEEVRGRFLGGDVDVEGNEGLTREVDGKGGTKYVGKEGLTKKVDDKGGAKDVDEEDTGKSEGALRENALGTKGSRRGGGVGDNMLVGLDGGAIA